MTTDAVVISGLGAVGPGAKDAETLWQLVLAGKSTAQHDERLRAAGLKVTLCGRVPEFDPDAELGKNSARRMDRYSHLALLAMREAVEHASVSLAQVAPERLGVIMGTGGGGFETWDVEYRKFLGGGPSKIGPLAMPKALSNTAAGLIAMRIGAQGPNMTVNTACGSGATAIMLACDMIRGGLADVMVAGGVEASVTGLCVGAFSQMGALSRNPDPMTASRPFDVARDGFVIGEGAGVVVLERAEHALARGVKPLATVAGGGSSADAFHITSPPEDGYGAQLAMRQALRASGLTLSDIDHINAHGTSTPPNDISEARAIRSVFGAAADGIAVTSTKGVTGHTLGAAGALEAIFSALTIRDRVIPPTANLDEVDPAVDLNLVRGEPLARECGAVMSNSFGFGGQNTVLVLTPA